jgi:septal ring factor EnvC (AmiA/AmiB activator)
MRRAVPALAAALAALLALAPPAPPACGQAAEDSAAAARRREEERRAEEQSRRQLETVQRQAREKREAAARLKAQESRELTRLRRTERDLGTTRRRLRQLHQRQRNLDQQLEITQVNLERSVATLEQQRRLLARRLRRLYMAGAGRELEFLLSTRSFAQLLARWDFLVMVAEQDRVFLEEYRDHRAAVEVQKQSLESNLAEVERTARRTEAENRKLASLRQERAKTVSSIQNQRQAYEAAAAELERTAKSIQRLLAQLERRRREEAERARAEGRTPQPYTGDFARGQGALEWPVRGSVVGRFGQEKHPRYDVFTMNNGVDIAVPLGTPVRSVARGRVDYVSEDYGSMGPMIIVNHGDGYFTLYGHLSEVLVSNAQEVAAGAVIGRSGEQGSLKGPVLHFEVRKGATPLDPEDWLR